MDPTAFAMVNKCVKLEFVALCSQAKPSHAKYW